MRRTILLTGEPRTGKTTTLLKATGELKTKSLKIGGMITQEIRKNGTRVGFKIIDISTKKEGFLAHTNQPKGPKIGKYTVCLEDLESIGVTSILEANEKADIIIIDEIGPMELCSEHFKKAVIKALHSRKIVLGTIHYRCRDPFITELKNRKDITTIEITAINRDSMPKIITQQISESHKAQETEMKPQHQTRSEAEPC